MFTNDGFWLRRDRLSTTLTFPFERNLLSLSLMTTLSQTTPFIFSLMMGTNDQFDFLEFLMFLVRERHLVPDDVLVMDNCAIHVTKATAPAIFELMEAAKVRLVFLPSYSPELNPCELVFAALKNYPRNHRGPEAIWREVLFALSTSVSYWDMVNLYFDCIWYGFDVE
jgi:transposase